MGNVFHATFEVLGLIANLNIYSFIQSTLSNVTYADILTLRFYSDKII